MANNVLGSIRVLLEAATASFEQGMNASAKLAAKTGKDIERAFTDLGSKAEAILGHISPMAGEFGTALAGIGSTANAVLGELAPLGEAVGGVGIGIGAIAAVGVGAATAMLGIAASAAETTARMGELSKSTGISVESLSVLGLVGKTVGVDSEQMATTLERMQKNLLQAAEGGGTAQKALKRLGVDILDAAGNLKPAEENLKNIAEAFIKLPEALKQGTAIELFGRGGAALIPFLEKLGTDGERLKQEFRSLGADIDDSLAAGAEKFEENKTLIGAAFSGISNQIERDLLPVLNTLARQFVDFFERNHEWIMKFANGLANLTKIVVDMGGIFKSVLEFIWLLFQQLGSIVVATFNAIGAGMEAGVKAAHFDFSGAKQSLREGYAGLTQETNHFFDENAKIWEKRRLFAASIFSNLPFVSAPDPSGGKPGHGTKDPNEFVTRKVQDAERAAQKQEELAAAIGKATSASIEAQAQAEANEKIQQLWDEAVDKGIQSTTKFQHAWLTAIPVLKTAAEWEQTFKAIAEDNKAFDQLEDKIRKENSALEAQAGATGKVAQEQAKWRSELANAGHELDEAQKHLDLLRTRFDESDPRLKAAQQDVQNLASRFNDLSKSVDQVNEKIQQRAFDKEADTLARQLVDAEEYNAALLKGGEAYARIDAELRKLTADLSLNAAQQAQVRQKLDELYRQQIIGEADKRVSNLSPETSEAGASLRLQQQYLEQLSETWKAQGKDVTNVQIAIMQVEAEYARMRASSQIALESAVHEWDEAVLKVGTFGDRTKAVMNEIWLEGQNTAKKIADAFLSAYDSLTTGLAKLATGQKADFGAIARDLAEKATKAEIQSGVSKLAEHIPGLSNILKQNDPLGSSAQRPMFVSIVNGFPASVPFGANNPFGVGFGIGANAQGAGGSIAGGNFLSGLGSLFGGFFAEGGDYTPGKAIIVGERGPELLVPKTTGTVIPNFRAGESRVTNNNITQHFNGFKDNDMFRRTARQTHAHTLRMLSQVVK